MKDWISGKKRNPENYRGTYPVISLRFADIKTNTYTDARLGVIHAIQYVFQSYKDKWTDDTEEEKRDMHV